MWNSSDPSLVHAFLVTHVLGIVKFILSSNHSMQGNPPSKIKPPPISLQTFQTPSFLCKPFTFHLPNQVHIFHSMDATTSSELPPGFRFHPTDEELIVYYLCNQATSKPCPASIIPEVDLYKFDPWELPGM